MNKGFKVVLLIGLVGVVLTFMGGRDLAKMSKDPIDMSTTDWGTLKDGDHVQVTIDMVWGQIYTETTEQTTFGITTSSNESGRGYAIPHLYVDQDGYYNIDYYIGLHLTNASDYRLIEQILDESDAWYYDTTGTVEYGMTTMYIDGTLKKMDSEEKALMEEYLAGCGYYSNEIDQMMCPYLITRGNVAANKGSLTIGIVLILISGGISVFMLLWNKKADKQFENNSYMGVVPTGSTDIYGGTNYGGDNFGGTNYNASNLSNPTYDGTVYGDTSYGGTNTYGQTGSYGGSDTYGQSNTYGQTGSYGGADTTGQSSIYGQTGSYGGADTYTNGSTYGSNNTYGSTETTSTDWPWQPKQ